MFYGWNVKPCKNAFLIFDATVREGDRTADPISKPQNRNSECFGRESTRSRRPSIAHCGRYWSAALCNSHLVSHTWNCHPPAHPTSHYVTTINSWSSTDMGMALRSFRYRVRYQLTAIYGVVFLVLGRQSCYRFLTKMYLICIEHSGQEVIGWLYD
jgi:hypothetical protein